MSEEKENSFWGCPTDLVIPPLFMKGGGDSYYETHSIRKWADRAPFHGFMKVQGEGEYIWRCVEVKKLSEEWEYRFKRNSEIGRQEMAIKVVDALPIELEDKVSFIKGPFVEYD